MTSPASTQDQNPAQNPSASSATSYASAASAAKKPTSTTLSAQGANPPPVVVGSSAPGTQEHGKKPASSSVNGSPAVAIPAGVGATNGHDRKTSVTISANGPNSYTANGGAVGGGPKGNIQFGYKESPGIVHSTPQQGTSAPIAIPGNNARVPSPAHSPSPIPQPSASGGRPPSMAQDGGSSMKFGSLGGDGERHMKHLSQGPHNNNNNSSSSNMGSPHMRHGSTHSIHDNVPSHGGPGMGRGGSFSSSGGRGRGGYNNQAGYNNPMGYPPTGQYGRGGAHGGQGRGGMPYQQNQRGMAPYPNSPQPRGSPAMGNAMPNPGTPTMNASLPVHPPQQGYNAYLPPSYPNNYGFAPPFDPRQQGMMGMGYQYPMAPNMPPYGMPPGGPAPSPGFSQQQAYPPGPYAPQAQPMSRNASQMSSDRPNSSTGHQQPSANPQGLPPHHTPTAKPAVVSSGPPVSSFVIPKKTTAKITIKNAAGEAVDFKALKPPASPAPSSQQAKTPPVVSSTPTPPPKPSTPSHVRSDSASNPKTAEQKRSEFMEQVRKTAAADAKDAAAAAEDTAEKTADNATVEAATDKAEKPVPEVEAKAVTADDASKDVAAEADKPSESKAEEVTETEDERFEREIREMEEREAEEERRQAEYEVKKKARLEEKKRQDEQDRVKNAADNDRKLREQEAEMERLEEEKERKRAEAEASGKVQSVSDVLAGKTSKAPTKAPEGVSSVTDKLASLSVKDNGSVSPAIKSGNSEKTTKSKPAALNLAPLNTKPVEPPQPSAALQSLKSARFLEVIAPSLYPAGIHSPNPSLNAAVSKKGKSFKYDANFLLQFQKVFTEQPSMEFGQQVKTLIGDGDRTGSARTPASSRQPSGRGAGGPAGAFPGIGSFMPPGKGSGSAFASMGPPSRGGGSMGSIGSFQRPFPGGAPGMQRNPSTSSMHMPPGSPRQASRRGGSKRNDFSNSKQEAQAAKTMPLTAGMDLKPIAVSASGWKPMSLTKAGGNTAPSGHLEPDVVQRKVKAALNKMTPEKFDKIADQILEIAAQSKDEQDGRTLRQVIQLTFEKATDEAHWASMYAKFCKRMLETMSAEIRDISIKDKNGNVVSGGALFRKYLLNRCQEEFERGWKVDLPKPDEGEEKKALGEAAMLSDEYYITAAAKRRGLGLVQFIGELYKLGMLTERIMHQCVQKLVDYSGIPDEAEVESLSKLLRTIGANLDQNADKTQGRAMMDAYFDRITTMMNLPDLPSRLKFMLLDVIDLRRSGWHSKEANKGPKTLDEVRAEAEAAAAQKAAENARTNQRGGPRPPMGGRNDMRGISGYGQPQQNQNQVGMDDLRRLKGSAMRTSSQNATFGPTSMFASRSNSGRARLGAGGPFGRAGEESGASSRTATPPTRESTSHANAFSLLANMETENPTSPPAVSPAMTKATPDTSDKK